MIQKSAPFCKLRRETGGTIDDPQAMHRRETVGHVPSLIPEAVGEAQEEAREATQGDQSLSHGPAHHVAGALVGDDGRE